MPRIDVTPRKAPRQARALVTVESILEAAARVLERDSLAGFNTNRVAEVAGISVGSLYQYFPNKSALIGSLIDRAQGDLADALEALVDRTSRLALAPTLRAVVRLAVRQQYAKPLLAAALDHEEKRLPVQPRLVAAERRIVASVATLLRRHRSEIGRGLLRQAPADCLTIAKAMVEADALAGRPPGGDLERRVVRALLGYLTGPARSLAGDARRGPTLVSSRGRRT